MYLNGYSVRIPEGSENEASGYVEMEHDTQYTLQLRNNNSTRCDAEVKIDGKHVGTFRLGAHDSMKLERSADDNRRFTCYLRDSEEGEEVELKSISKNELGLIQVTFKPEKVVTPVVVKRVTLTKYDDDSRGVDYDCLGLSDTTFGTASPPGVTYSKGITRGLSATPVSYSANAAPTSNYAPVGTGMSGHSNQKFYDVPELNYDDERITEINLRLVGKKRSTRGPLKPVQKSTPIPPPVWMLLL